MSKEDGRTGLEGGMRGGKKDSKRRKKIPYVTRMENRRREGISGILTKAQKG